MKSSSPRRLHPSATLRSSTIIFHPSSQSRQRHQPLSSASATGGGNASSIPRPVPRRPITAPRSPLLSATSFVLFFPTPVNSFHPPLPFQPSLPNRAQTRFHPPLLVFQPVCPPPPLLLLILPFSLSSFLRPNLPTSRFLQVLSKSFCPGSSRNPPSPHTHQTSISERGRGRTKLPIARTPPFPIYSGATLSSGLVHARNRVIHISVAAASIPYFPIKYESKANRPKFLPTLFRHVDLPEPSWTIWTIISSSRGRNSLLPNSASKEALPFRPVTLSNRNQPPELMD